MPTILVVDDNPANLELMRYLLAAFGHAPLTAGDGPAGLALAREGRPDLVICDIQMAGMDGFGVLRELRADPATAATPVVAVTALAMPSDQDAVARAGFDGYIAKPIDPQLFVAQIERFLGARPAPHAPPEAAAAEEAPAAAAEARATVLVVDDHPTNRDLIESILRYAGYRVLTAEGVGEALAIVRAGPVDLIFSDLHMPGGGGFELLRQLGAGGPRVIIHSATLRSELDRREALRLGAARFITDPLEPALIMGVVAECLAEAG